MEDSPVYYHSCNNDPPKSLAIIGTFHHLLQNYLDRTDTDKESRYTKAYRLDESVYN